MVIHYLDVLCAPIRPAKAYAVLIVDPDAMLARASAFQQFQPIALRHAKIIQPAGNLKLPKLSAGDDSNI
jgi:hypothetical protein